MRSPVWNRPRDGLPGNTVVDDHRSQLKVEGILPDQIIVHSHLKRGAKYTAHRMDRAVAASFFLQLDQPALGIRQVHLVDPQLSEFFLRNDVDHKVVIGFGIVANAGLQGHIFLD